MDLLDSFTRYGVWFWSPVLHSLRKPMVQPIVEADASPRPRLSSVRLGIFRLRFFLFWLGPLYLWVRSDYWKPQILSSGPQHFWSNVKSRVDQHSLVSHVLVGNGSLPFCMMTIGWNFSTPNGNILIAPSIRPESCISG